MSSQSEFPPNDPLREALAGLVRLITFGAFIGAIVLLSKVTE